jgi:membrane fusion protein, multidrug efflux system
MKFACARHPRNMFPHLRRALWIVPLLALSFLASGCQKKTLAQEAEVPRPVRVIKLSLANTADTLDLPAEVRPRFETRYGFRVGGKIATRSVSLGELVKPGQELARIDPTDVTPAINAQTAQLESARTDAQLQNAELKRTRELREKNFISQTQLDRQLAAYDSAAARVRAAEAQLKQVRNALEFTTLRADKPGVVTAIDAEAGQVVAVGQSIVRVAQLGEKEVIVNVPESDIERLRRAQTLAIRVSALGQRSFTVKLRELSPLADAASRTFLARLTVVDPSEDLKLGMTATLATESAGEQAMIVPLTALKSTGDQAQVWVVEPGAQTVRAADVKLGATSGRGVIISTGLRPGDLIVTAGAHLLIAGQKVRVLE